MSRRVRRRHSDEFKREDVKLMTEQGVSLSQAARDLGVNENLLRSWKRKFSEDPEVILNESEQKELARLREENRRLRMEREILKKRRPSSRTKRTEIRVHPNAQRRMAGECDVRSSGCVGQRLLRMELTCAEPSQ